MQCFAFFVNPFLTSPRCSQRTFDMLNYLISLAVSQRYCSGRRIIAKRFAGRKCIA
jgi:hypothetical protein